MSNSSKKNRTYCETFLETNVLVPQKLEGSLADLSSKEAGDRVGCMD